MHTAIRHFRVPIDGNIECLGGVGFVPDGAADVEADEVRHRRRGYERQADRALGPRTVGLVRSGRNRSDPGQEDQGNGRSAAQPQPKRRDPRTRMAYSWGHIFIFDILSGILRARGSSDETRIHIRQRSNSALPCMAVGYCPSGAGLTGGSTSQA